MVSLPEIPLLFVYTAIGTVLTGIVTFLVVLYIYDLDRKTESYDEDLRTTIEEGSSFSGIERAASPDFIATSDSRFSKATSTIKKHTKRLSDKPDKFVVVEGQNMEQRRIEMIRERVQEIPGRSLLTSDLVGAIRAHYGLQLALSQEEVSSGVVEHFKSNLEEYEHSEKVQKLADPDNFSDFLLLEGEASNSNRDALNDVYLDLVQAAERYCVDVAPDTKLKKDEMDRCQRVLMITFWGMWVEKSLGIVVDSNLDTNDCVTAYRRDIRDEDNWGYWMLPISECEDDEFKRVRHLGWKIQGFVDQHWEDDPFLKLYPKGPSIKEMNQVPTPFVIFHKEEQVFRGGGPGGSS